MHNKIFRTEYTEHTERKKGDLNSPGLRIPQTGRRAERQWTDIMT